MIKTRAPILDEAALKAELDTTAAAGRDDRERRAFALTVLRRALERGRAEAKRRLEAGLPGLAAARAQASVADAVVRALHHFTTTHVLRSSNPTEGERLALAATGGYGRAVLAPYSDLDLLFLRPWKVTSHSESVIEFMLYALWDLGLKVGHASRTIDECLRAARQDMTVRTALLDARLLAGDAALFDDMRRRFRDLAAETGPEFVAAKLKERDVRHARAGATRYLVEPNVKDGKGALRDLNTLIWIARYLHPADAGPEALARPYLDQRQLTVLRSAYDFFWAVRAHLHHVAGRAEERLGFDLQAELARRMGHARGDDETAVKRFMRRYFLMTREVGALTRTFCAKLEAERSDAPTRLSRLLPARLRRGEGGVGVKGFRRQRGRLTLDGPEVLAEDPVNLIRLFAVADERGLDLHPDAIEAVRRSLRRITPKVRRDPKARRTFLDLLVKARQPYRTLSLMNETGVLPRFIPEFGRIVAQTQFDRHHAYTTDEHTLRAVGAISEIEHGLLKDDHPLSTTQFPRIKDREALYLAMLLHDIGKGGAGGQLTAGARAARVVCERLAIEPARVDLITWLVEHHLLFSDYAQKRDVADPGTIAAFAETVGDLERLRLLLVLTVADIRAVGPGVWNGWKGQLMRELYASTEAAFRGGGGADAATRFRRRLAEAAAEAQRKLVSADPGAAAFAAGMEDAYLAGFSTEELRGHARLAQEAEAKGAAAFTRMHAVRKAAAITVAARDRPGLFADLAATLTAAGAQVLYARIHTSRTGLALDVFHVQDATGAPYGHDHPRRLKDLADKLAAVAAGRQPAPLPAAGGKRPARTGAAGSVTFDTASSEHALIVEVAGRDRPGLLADLARAVTNAGLTMVSAHVGSYGDRAVDAFYVTDAEGEKPTEEARLKVLGRALLEAVAEPGRPAGAPAKAAAV